MTSLHADWLQQICLISIFRRAAQCPNDATGVVQVLYKVFIAELYCRVCHKCNTTAIQEQERRATAGRTARYRCKF